MMGMTMSVIHSLETFGWAATRPLRESTRWSAVTYAKAVEAMSKKMATGALSFMCSALDDDEDIDGETWRCMGRVSVDMRPKAELFDETIDPVWQVSRKRWLCE